MTSSQPPKIQERFQVYVQALGTLASGGYLVDVPKTIDTEAPFALRGISIRIARTDEVETYSAVNDLLFNWKNSNNMYTQSDLLPVPVALGCGVGGFGGIGGNPGIVYPEVIYPAGSTINIDLTNSGDNDLDITVYFWGTKLFPAGGIDAPTYPARCAMLDYRRQFTALALTPTEVRRNQILKVAADADYVFRAGQCGCNNTTPYFPQAFQQFKNLLVTLSDHNVKPYMDAPVDVNYLWGTSQGTFGQGSAYTGNANPGLHVPEIYVRANDLLYLDFYRQDGAITGANDNDVQIAFQGSKVYLK